MKSSPPQSNRANMLVRHTKEIKRLWHKMSLIIRWPFLKLTRNIIDITDSVEQGVLMRSTSLGKYVYIGPHAIVLWADVGNYTCIAGDVCVGGMNHAYREDVSINPLLNPYCSMEKNGRTKIGHDVWIGAKCTILQGITIGDGAIIGAGSVVTKDVPENTIVYGTPARFYRKRFPDDVWEKINVTHFWNYSPENAKKIIRELDIKFPLQ